MTGDTFGHHSTGATGIWWAGARVPLHTPPRTGQSPPQTVVSPKMAAVPRVRIPVFDEKGNFLLGGKELSQLYVGWSGSFWTFSPSAGAALPPGQSSVIRGYCRALSVSGSWGHETRTPVTRPEPRAKPGMDRDRP